MTRSEQCPRHGTVGRELPATSRLVGEPVFVCDECELTSIEELFAELLVAVQVVGA